MGARPWRSRRGLAMACGIAAVLPLAAVAMAADTVFVDGDTASPAPNLSYGGGGRDCSTLGGQVSGQIVVNYNGGGTSHFQAGESLAVGVTDPAGVTTALGVVPNVPANWNSNDDQFTIPFSTTVSSSIADGAYQVLMTVTGNSSGYAAGSGSGDGRPLYVVNVSCGGGTGGPVNQSPSVTVNSAAAIVDEGSEVTNSGTYSDPDAGDSVTLSASRGTIVQDPNGSAGTWSWSETPDDGPGGSPYTVTVTATDSHTASGTASFSLTVNNVPPTITSITPNVATVLTGQNVTFTGQATDPSSADTTWGFNWAWNGGSFGAAGANTFTTAFLTCGPNSVTAQARDKDGGVSASATSSAVAAYTGHFLPPLNEGIYNAVQKGQVVPVKISVGCNGANLTGLTPKIQLLSGDIDPATDPGDSTLNVATASVSNADTTGQMRAIDGGYIYNLAVPGNATANTLFTIRVTPFGTAGGGSMYVVIKIRK